MVKYRYAPYVLARVVWKTCITLGNRVSKKSDDHDKKLYDASAARICQERNFCIVVPYKSLETNPTNIQKGFIRSSCNDNISIASTIMSENEKDCQPHTSRKEAEELQTKLTCFSYYRSYLSKIIFHSETWVRQTSSPVIPQEEENTAFIRDDKCLW